MLKRLEILLLVLWCLASGTALAEDGYMPGDMSAAVRSVRKVSAEEAGEIRAARMPDISTLEGRHVEIDVLEGEFRDVVMYCGMRYTHRKGCWPRLWCFSKASDLVWRRF